MKKSYNKKSIIWLFVTSSLLIAGAILSFLVFSAKESTREVFESAEIELASANQAYDSALEFAVEKEAEADYWYSAWLRSSWFLSSLYLNYYEDAVYEYEQAVDAAVQSAERVEDAELSVEKAHEDLEYNEQLFLITVSASALVFLISLVMTILSFIRAKKHVLNPEPDHTGLKQKDGSWVCTICETKNESGLFCLECGSSLKELEEKLIAQGNVEANAEEKTKSDEQSVELEASKSS